MVICDPGESLNMVPWYASTHKERCKRVISVTDWLQKGDIFAKKGRCLTEDTPVTPKKGVLW